MKIMMMKRMMMKRKKEMMKKHKLKMLATKSHFEDSGKS
jgi:hypothetical protein